MNNNENQLNITENEPQYFYLAGQLMACLKELGSNKSIGQITAGDLLKIAKEITNEYN